MSVLVQIGLAAIAVHAAHLRLLPTLATILGLWALVSLVAGFLLGRGAQALHSRHELPKEILEAPPGPNTQSGLPATTPFVLQIPRLSRRLLPWKARGRIV